MNPELYRYIEEARRIYPHSKIGIVTNGILMGAIDDRLKETMKRNNALFCPSLYPPIKNYVRNAMRQLARDGIFCEECNDVTHFFSVLNPAGTSDAAVMDSSCPVAFCTIFGNGKVSKCCYSQDIPVYKAFYHLSEEFPDCGFDLYTKDATPQNLQSFLMHPVEMCRYCGKPKAYPWAPAGKNPGMEDWFCDGENYLCEK